LEWVEQLLGISLSPGQRKAVESTLVHKAVVITGGPGTGKTTVLRGILQILSRLNLRIALAAPTGRAAKRMQEATGWEAKTIHRLLEWQGSGFARNEDRPLDCDLVVVDELSMVDTLLAYQLLRAVPDSAHLVLVGDADQLPSIGAGSVLRDLIASQVVPTITLTDIFRQSGGSSIVANAHRINHGEMPVFEDAADSYFIEQGDAARVAEIVVELVGSRIPRRFELDPRHEIQVLSPMHRGEAGVANLNRRLQEVLNPGGASLGMSGTEMRVGDKVMQMRNNYELEVFNGDIGRIVSFDDDTEHLRVRFDDRVVEYPYASMRDLGVAYAITIHKSQGSEYPVVVIPVLTQHYIMLQRNLLYTAVTRASQMAILVGSERAVEIAVRNRGAQHRHTRLDRRLRERVSQKS
jgi:exodeoxyribonuclease V alpha subunit